MIEKFVAIGYHGTEHQNIDSMLKSINYSLNKGDKFLGQGLYLWRDSYDRAYKWAKKTKKCVNIGILGFEIKCHKKYVLNFSSKSWNSEELLIETWRDNFEHLTFGEFLDEMIYKQNLEVNIVSIIDLSNNINSFKIEDETNKTNFAIGDLQICLKNDHPIVTYGEIS